MIPIEAQRVAKQAGVDFAIKRVMSIWLLGGVIKPMKAFKPGKPQEATHNGVQSLSRSSPTTMRPPRQR